MQCPVDGSTLLMSVRERVEIDYCPQCRGVWLDRGELDKLIEQADRDDGDRDRERPDDRDRDRDRDRSPRYDDRPRHHDRHEHSKPRRKKWLSEMFDFD